MTDRPLLRRIVGTAGHIDHGKSSLVRSLTGTDPDRLPEEKRRGITIDLGFASLNADGTQIGFVDVPGHERFVRNMLAGAGGIDLVMLVIAADESIMPQTREHFDICRMLGVKDGLVVITKADLVESDMLELVRMEAADLVQGSFLEGKPVLAVSSATGQGLDELRNALINAVRGSAERQTGGRSARLPIDRVFSIRGFGTVVTGTLVAGSIRTEGELELLPSGRRVRARSIEVHGEKRDEAAAGERTSVNINVELDDVQRGDTLTSPGGLRATNLLTVEIRLLESAPELRDGARVHLHLYASETLATVRFIGRESKTLTGGETAIAQLRLADPVVATVDDRFVLRRYSPVITVGGGRVLDPLARRMPSTTSTDSLLPLLDDSLARKIEWWARREGIRGITLPAIVQRTGLSATAAGAAVSDTLMAVRADGPWLHHDAVQSIRRSAMEILQAWFREQRMTLGMPKQTFLQKLLPRKVDSAVVGWILADLEREKIAKVAEDLVDVPGRKKELGGTEGELAKRVERVYAEAGLQPPNLGDLVRSVSQKPKIVEGMIAYLVRLGVLVRLADGLWVHRDAVAAVRERLAPHSGETIDVAWFKDLLGLSRKVAIPLLEHLDASGVTRRVGDRREIS